MWASDGVRLGEYRLEPGKECLTRCKLIGAVTEKIVYRPHREKLPEERQSLTHKFAVGGHEGYITVGLYEDASS